MGDQASPPRFLDRLLHYAVDRHPAAVSRTPAQAPMRRMTRCSSRPQAPRSQQPLFRSPLACQIPLPTARGHRLLTNLVRLRQHSGAGTHRGALRMQKITNRSAASAPRFHAPDPSKSRHYAGFESAVALQLLKMGSRPLAATCLFQVAMDKA